MTDLIIAFQFDSVQQAGERAATCESRLLFLSLLNFRSTLQFGQPKPRERAFKTIQQIQTRASVEDERTSLDPPDECEARRKQHQQQQQKSLRPLQGAPAASLAS